MVQVVYLVDAAPAKQWQRFRRSFKKAGRPTVGGGAARLQITVERSLLKQADAYAHSHGLTRSQLVARGLQSVIAG